jgi:putative Holliday junction resolvase
MSMDKGDFSIKGRVMGLDLGGKRIGIAISDPTRTIAQSYGVLKRGSRQLDFERYARIIEEQKITLLVVGLPLMLSGEDSETTRWVRDYTADLRQHIDIPVEFWDESLSTVQAEASLRLLGKRGKKARQQVDAVAATIILQGFLDAHG